MKCERSDRLSLWFDGELPADEARAFARHLEACAACRAAREDFLRLRAELRAGGPADDPFARRRTLESILRPQPSSFWSRRVAVPAPLLAALLVAVVGLGWLSWRDLRASASGPSAVVRPVDASGDSRPDLARYDRGGRIALRKIPRPPEVGVTGGGAR